MKIMSNEETDESLFWRLLDFNNLAIERIIAYDLFKQFLCAIYRNIAQPTNLIYHTENLYSFSSCIRSTTLEPEFSLRR